MLVVPVIVLHLLAPLDLYKNGIMVKHCATVQSIARIIFVLQTHILLFT